MSTVRCVGCGKVLEDGVKTVRVAIGKNSGSAFTESKEWGRLHEACFDGAIASPHTALAQVRKIKKQTAASSKKA